MELKLKLLILAEAETKTVRYGEARLQLAHKYRFIKIMSAMENIKQIKFTFIRRQT